MAINRYNKDYRLIEEFDEKGHVKTSYEYIGKDYVFSEGLSEAEKVKKPLLTLVILSWAAYIAALSLASGAMHSLFLALPFAFTALPLAMLSELVFTLQKLSEPMEHRFADRLNNRYPPIVLGIMLFDEIALIGQAIRLILGKEMLPGDILFTVGALVILAVGYYAFHVRKRISAKEADL